MKKVSGWNDLRAGQSLSGKVEKVLLGVNGQYKLKVSVGEKIVGLVDFYNTADMPKTGPVPKHIKEGRKIRVRILNVNASEKTLRFTLK